ncbi:uncharacterized protein CLUP02_13315 [Colletotrichum lupini]|uniref:Uncharacterized protein n=1 Tax=Colletotrichum lupini TaxID=145971 RepID=A0A9Q8T258_9PEZI|nr:uncharacterized protein CLUP02_13315 [Colletotrichum lupini]UQC87796.1 hypothetical protein CLUP02_13315 [Colletotrichum lupini]
MKLFRELSFRLPLHLCDFAIGWHGSIHPELPMFTTAGDNEWLFRPKASRFNNATSTEKMSVFASKVGWAEGHTKSVPVSRITKNLVAGQSTTVIITGVSPANQARDLFPQLSTTVVSSTKDPRNDLGTESLSDSSHVQAATNISKMSGTHVSNLHNLPPPTIHGPSRQPLPHILALLISLLYLYAKSPPMARCIVQVLSQTTISPASSHSTTTRYFSCVAWSKSFSNKAFEASGVRFSMWWMCMAR